MAADSSEGWSDPMKWLMGILSALIVAILIGNGPQLLEWIKKDRPATEPPDLRSWSIVISTDTEPSLAQRWAQNIIKRWYTPAFVYRHGHQYNVAVGSYPSQKEAEQALPAVEKITRSDAYDVAIGSWCPDPRPTKEGDVTVFYCGAA